MITQQQLFEVIAKAEDLDPTSLTLETKLSDLGIDSLAKMELIFHVEDQYKIMLPSNELDVSTLGEVLDLVNRHLP